MAHRSKHRRGNWGTEREEAALERSRVESERPAPKVREKRRRVLPVSAFLAHRVKPVIR